MTEDQLNEQHATRLTEVLGTDYRNHVSYPYVVREVGAGRSVSNVLADLTPASTPRRDESGKPKRWHRGW